MIWTLKDDTVNQTPSQLVHWAAPPLSLASLGQGMAKGGGRSVEQEAKKPNLGAARRSIKSSLVVLRHDSSISQLSNLSSSPVQSRTSEVPAHGGLTQPEACN